ncbi:MAG: hypothetical protein ACR2JA_19210 [Hydrogenophaga sp.]|uniref:hypothetical protein n=1 Tax=Hydrogenophaga sp. TaxID=1904254 RepID=UPI003D9BE995
MSSSLSHSIKPGLWEMRHTMGGKPQMDQVIAQMEKQIETMLGQQGVTMPTPGAGGSMARRFASPPK